MLPAPLRQREIEENLWRAIRYGLDGEMIDFSTRRADPDAGRDRAPRGVDGARQGELGIEVDVPERNGAQRARAALEDGASLREVYAAGLEETGRTYVGSRSMSVRLMEGGPAAAGREPAAESGGAAGADRGAARQIRVQDLLLESVVGILNLSARRIAKPDERDLEQARIGIEAVRAVVDMLEPEPAAASARRALGAADALRPRGERRRAGEDAAASRARRRSPAAPPPQGSLNSRPAGRRGDLPPRLWTPARHLRLTAAASGVGWRRSG